MEDYTLGQNAGIVKQSRKQNEICVLLYMTKNPEIFTFYLNLRSLTEYDINDK